MDALLYLLSLGFSGSDVTRAIILILIGALFVTRRFPPLKMTAALLLVDVLWPYVMMVFADGGHRGVELAIRGAFHAWEDNLVAFLVRAAGFYVAIRGTYSIRRRLHESGGEPSGKAGALPF